MKWKVKDKPKQTDWCKIFAWKPIKTENGYIVWLEYVYKRYKIHMDGGKYVYKTIEI